MPKFVFITGGVMSGLGKGLVTCSIGKILQVRGFTVNAVSYTHLTLPTKA